MSARYYPAEQVEDYLQRLRLGFENRVNQHLAEGGDLQDPLVIRLTALSDHTQRITDTIAPIAVMLPDPEEQPEIVVEDDDNSPLAG